LVERFDAELCEFDVIRAQSPIVPDGDATDQCENKRSDPRLLYSDFRNDDLHRTSVLIPNEDERIRFHLADRSFADP
jgi:hypothetical protein